MPPVTPGQTPADNLMRIDAAIRNNFGGEVTLEGTFPFGPSGNIKINTPITIKAGTGGATIQDGTSPFQINAPGQAVTIQGIHFAQPTKFAIEVSAVNTLLITTCKIIGPVILVPQTIDQSPMGKVVVFPFGGGIAVGGGPNTVGNLTITESDIDVGGGTSDRTTGVTFIKVGSPTVKANISLIKNHIRNVTAHAIDLRDITGTALIEDNQVEPGPNRGAPADLLDSFFDGIRCLGIGGYIVHHNPITCVNENCAAIRLQGNSPTAAITGAFVTNNEISMSIPRQSTPGNENAAIEIRRNCGSNSVSNNIITGDARAALSLMAGPNPLDPTQTTLIPNHNGLTDNRLDKFKPSLADIFVGQQVDSTSISNFFDSQQSAVNNPGRTVTIIDEGTNTKVRGFYRILRKGSVM